MIGFVLMLYGVSAIIGLLMLVRVFRASVLDGILCLFLPFWTIVVLIKYWNEPDHDIKFYFFGQLALLGVALLMITRLERHEARMNDTAQTAQAESDDDGDDNDNAGDAASKPIDSASNRHAKARPEHTAGNATASAPASTPAPARSREAETPVRAPTAEELAPPPLRVVLHNVTFQRGTMERSSAGFRLEIPDHFHALSATDAHRLEASQRQTPDGHEVAWVAHETVALDAPDAWHVSVR